MSLTTKSIFYYGHVVDTSNNKISFDEGGPELIATIVSGSYTITDYATAIETALNNAGALTYTVTVVRATPTIKVDASGTFSLLVSTGTSGSSAFPLMGFTGADRTGAATYTGDSTSGTTYEPQVVLQDHIAKEDKQSAVDATVSKSASGRIQVVTFGTEKFVRFSIKLITNITQATGGPITTSATAVADAEAFLQSITTKAPFEFMPDVGDRSTFDELILESTPESGDGVAYELKEQYGRGLPGYFNTGILLCRVV